MKESDKSRTLLEEFESARKEEAMERKRKWEQNLAKTVEDFHKILKIDETKEASDQLSIIEREDYWYFDLLKKQLDKMDIYIDDIRQAGERGAQVADVLAEGYRRLAKQVFDELKNGVPDNQKPQLGTNKEYVDIIKQYLRWAGMKLEGIGTNSEEIEHLRKTSTAEEDANKFYEKKRAEFIEVFGKDPYDM